MAAKNCLPSASWRARKASGVIHGLQAWDSRATRASLVRVWIWEPESQELREMAGGQEKMDVTAPAESESALLCLSVLFRLSADQMLPAHWCGSASLSPQTHPEIVFDQLSEHPWAQPSWHIELMSTDCRAPLVPCPVGAGSLPKVSCAKRFALSTGT